VRVLEIREESIKDHFVDFIALLEIGRSKCGVPFPVDLVSGHEFSWYLLPPRVRSGGIFVGINTKTLTVKRVDNGDFFVKLVIRSKFDGFGWALVPIYGVLWIIINMNFFLS
jgi:hypothetical protein